MSWKWIQIYYRNFSTMLRICINQRKQFLFLLKLRLFWRTQRSCLIVCQVFRVVVFCFLRTYFSCLIMGEIGGWIIYIIYTDCVTLKTKINNTLLKRTFHKEHVLEKESMIENGKVMHLTSFPLSATLWVLFFPAYKSKFLCGWLMVILITFSLFKNKSLYFFLFFY